MAASSSSPWKTMDRRMNRREMLIKSLAQIKNALPQLSTIKSCAMIGCGYGNLDLEFVGSGGCLTDITEMAAVEPDAEEMAEFKNRVAQLLPAVRIDFFQETAQSWNGADKRFESVLLFNCLYYLTLPERLVLFKKLFDNVVASGGLVFIAVNSCQCQNPANVFGRLICVFGLPADNYSLKDIDESEIRDMMTSVGFCEIYELPIKCELNVKDLDDDFMSVFMFWSGGRLSLETVRKAAKEVYGGENVIPYTMWFMVFRKP